MSDCRTCHGIPTGPANDPGTEPCPECSARADLADDYEAVGEAIDCLLTHLADLIRDGHPTTKELRVLEHALQLLDDIEEAK